MKKLFILFFIISCQINSFNLNKLKTFCSNNPEDVSNQDFKPFDIESILNSLKSFIEQEKETLNKSSFLGKKIKTHKFPAKFQPFVKKLILKPTDKISMWGDLHGSIHSLHRDLNYLYEKNIIDQNFKILKDNFYMAFLGDFVDRGLYGIEVVYTLITLKLQNPDKVILVRGNHEDIGLNTRYGLKKELDLKYPDKLDLLEQVSESYNYMPVALFVGCKDTQGTTNFIQCCHGGLDFGYLPNELLQSDLNLQRVRLITRSTNIEKLRHSLKEEVKTKIPSHEIQDVKPIKPCRPFTLGLMWHDFTPIGEEEVISYMRGRGWKYGQELTENYFELSSSEKSKLRRIIRAHQHNGKMLKDLISKKGVVPMWNSQVTTLLSAPASGFGFENDSFIILNLDNNYEDYKIEHVLLN